MHHLSIASGILLSVTAVLYEKEAVIGFFEISFLFVRISSDLDSSFVGFGSELQLKE